MPSLQFDLRLLWLALAIPLTMLACTSTLNEYQCAKSNQCTADGVPGRCEASGHCSFSDDLCPGSGFRFGESAGSESNQCVEGSGIEDGGIVGGRPIAVIGQLPDFECGETSVFVDGSGSQAFGGAEIVGYQWTLRDILDETLDTFSGDIDSVPVPGIHRIGGSMAKPEINFPPYHRGFALKANVNDPNVHRIYQDLENFSADVSGNFRLYFAIAHTNPQQGSQTMTAGVRTVDGIPIISKPFTVTPEFVEHTADIDLVNGGAGMTLGALSLEFRFDEPGSYWLDNVAVLDVVSGEVVTINPSIEAIADPWELGDGNIISMDMRRESIPPELLQSGIFTVELVVTDSNDQISEPATADVLLSGCAGP